MLKSEFSKAMAAEVPRPHEVTENGTTMMLRRIFWDLIDDQLPLSPEGGVAEGNEIFDPFKTAYNQLRSSFEKGDPTLDKISSFYHDFILKMVYVLRPKDIEVQSTHVTHAEPLDHHSHAPTAIHTDAMPQGARGSINLETA